MKSFESSKISQLITDFEISQKNDLTIGPIKQIMTGFKKAYDNTLSSQIRNFKKGTRLYLKRFSEKKNHVSKSQILGHSNLHPKTSFDLPGGCKICCIIKQARHYKWPWSIWKEVKFMFTDFGTVAVKTTHKIYDRYGMTIFSIFNYFFGSSNWLSHGSLWASHAPHRIHQAVFNEQIQKIKVLKIQIR